MTFSKGRRGFPAGPSAVLALLLLTGCALGSDGTSDVSDTPRRDLAGRPAAPAPASGQPSSAAPSSPGASAEASAAGPSAGLSPAPGTPAGTSAPQAPGASPAAPYRQIAVLDDVSGDSGLGTPPYADLRRLTLADNGPSARVTVDLGGRLPAKAAVGEAIGIGVDLYRTAGQREGDYQLFADGGPDGWFAYLHSPKGFVRYPGTFALTANGLVFTVPWRSLGGTAQGRFSAFADWTRRGTTGNDAGNDRAPLLGNTAYAR